MDIAPSPEFLRSKAMLAANRRNARTHLDKLDTKALALRSEKSPERFSGVTTPSAPASVVRGILFDGAATPPAPGEYVLPMEYQEREPLARWLR